MTSEPEHKTRSYPSGGGHPFLLGRPVPPELEGMVRSIVGYAENGARLAGAIEMAPLVVPLIVSFGDAFEIALGRMPRPGETYASFTSGLFPGYVAINSTGRSSCVQVDFTPPGAARFFGFPMSELAGRMVDLQAIADPGIDDLRLRLGDCDDWNERLAMTEHFLRQRLLATEPVRAPVMWAYEAILHTHGRVRIGDIAQRLGWSRKHLVACFRDSIGIAPKSVARMARFNRALEIARVAGGGWAEIAAECGYSDQAHLVREFHEFAGHPPTALARAA